MNIKLIAFVGCILVHSLVFGHRGNDHHHDHDHDHNGDHHGGHNHHHGGGHNGHHHGHHGPHGHQGGHHHGYHGGHHGHHGGPHGHHGRHHWHHWHHHAAFLNFEVHEPKGLTVSMVLRSPNDTFFGIELFVNQDPKRVNETHCDVCQNTTTITYGKFIVEDELVVIKKGDVLYYNVLLGNSTNVTRLHPQRLWVTESIISKCNCEAVSENPDIDVRFEQSTAKPGVVPDSSSELDDPIQSSEFYPNENVLFECEVDPATNLCRTAQSEKLTHGDGDLQREVEILEAIVEKMKKSCGSSGTTNLVRLEKFDSNLGDTAQLTDYVRSSLSVIPEMRQLASRVHRIMPESGSSRVVLVDMTSYTDKQKMLYHAQMNNLKHISDYDVKHFGRPGRRH